MKDRIARWFAYHLPPRLVYWAAIRVMVHSTTGKYSQTNPSDVYAIEAIYRFGTSFKDKNEYRPKNNYQ